MGADTSSDVRQLVVFGGLFTRERFCLAKFYVAADDRIEAEKLTRVLLRIVELCGLKPEILTVNSPRKIPISRRRLIQVLKSVPIQDLETLYLMESDFKYGVTVTPAFKTTRDWQPKIQIRVVFRLSRAYIEIYDTLFEELATRTSVLHGYGRILPGSYSPVTEKRMKKSLLGGVTAVVTRQDADWIIHPDKLHSGAIKGFFQILLVRKSLEREIDDIASRYSYRRSIGDDLIYLRN